MRRIATTSSARLRPLGTAGQRSYELITHTLARNLGPGHAALFAEPVLAENGDLTDWYTGLEGRPRPLATLDAEMRATAEARLLALTDQIRGHAASLRATQDPDSHRLAEALENAVSIPGEDSVYVILGEGESAAPQPVLINWASVPDTEEGRSNAELTGWMPRRPTRTVPPPAPAEPTPTATEGAAETAAPSRTAVPAPVPQSPPPRSTAYSWVGALLVLSVALLSAAILYLLLRACGLAGVGGLQYCPAPAVFATVAPEDPATDLLRDRDVLLNRISYLERDLAERDAACQPVVVDPEPEPEPEPEPPPPPPPDDEITERLDRENATEGEAEVALIWNSYADIDLHVTCPAGEEVFYGNDRSDRCGGRLDIDMNAGSGDRLDPVEHVYFERRTPGRYVIQVVLFDRTVHPGPHPFQLRIRFGDDVRDLSGTVSSSNPVWRYTYEYSP